MAGTNLERQGTQQLKSNRFHYKSRVDAMLEIAEQRERDGNVEGSRVALELAIALDASVVAIDAELDSRRNK